MSQVVVDASLAAMWAIREQYSQLALSLVNKWIDENTSLIAPGLLLPEVTNAIYKRVTRNEIGLEAAHEAVETIFRFEIEILEEPFLPFRAIELAHEAGQPTIYDCYYLALAEYHQCEFWTGDQRLHNSVKNRLPWVKWIGTYRVTI